MRDVRWMFVVLIGVFLCGCVTPVAIEAAKPRPHLCEVHRVPTVAKSMPETPLNGIEDNGIHPEVKPYFDAKGKRFPYVGFNPPSCCGYHGGQLYPICPECVKAEDSWIVRHPRVPSPIYGTPDPRR